MGGELGELRGVGGLSSCQPRPAQRHHHTSPMLPEQPWLPQHPNPTVSWTGIKRRSPEVPSHADYPAAGIRAHPSAVVTFQVGGECSSSPEGRAEGLGLTPLSTSRAGLGPAPTQLQAFPVNPGKECCVSGSSVQQAEIQVGTGREDTRVPSEGGTL